jgi:hypothetical protein
MGRSIPPIGGHTIIASIEPVSVIEALVNAGITTEEYLQFMKSHL